MHPNRSIQNLYLYLHFEADSVTAVVPEAGTDSGEGEDEEIIKRFSWEQNTRKRRGEINQKYIR